ncbi:NAD(P)-binding protein [Laetiporus sulphureus 93-53]|uniref:NAD(P)-binding protein n=1 Tax=Laetiporus sulphureus 93-53 TaxID=1314785 RepID=A0A165BIJ1_9APHY|nr:NAD(P)-binding protein [Laetiporus sulphureus 93-53]KZT01125.1 NAD(P)-binding protein [Laetiporus sulphureus 93-53]
MTPSHYNRIIFVQRPTGPVDSSTFRQETLPFDLKPGDGQVLIRIQYLSIDPALRLLLDDIETFTTPMQIGEPVLCMGVGTVVESGKNSPLVPGNIISGYAGWTEYVVADAEQFTKVVVPDGANTVDALGALGHTGFTAYFGLIDVGKIQAGETLLVSAAAGATGSLVCQLGLAKGAKVYGIAGSQAKCEYLEKTVGVNKAFNYKSPTFHEDIARDMGGFDVFFDNVGGDMLDFALTLMNVHARVVMCGSISEYNSTQRKPFTNLFQVHVKRAKLEGFSLIDYFSRLAEGRQYLVELVKQGKLKQQYHIVNGLENAPKALGMLFTGENKGKLIVKVAD